MKKTQGEETQQTMEKLIYQQTYGPKNRKLQTLANPTSKLKQKTLTNQTEKSGFHQNHLVVLPITGPNQKSVVLTDTFSFTFV